MKEEMNLKRQKPRMSARTKHSKSGSYESPSHDTRNRGHLQQLMEKYNNLAREALVSGDRVQAESHFQYADHYFRVLKELKPVFSQSKDSEIVLSQDIKGEKDDVNLPSDVLIHQDGMTIIEEQKLA